jgi:cbb3-type cytochrome oxidase subunit 1
MDSSFNACSTVMLMLSKSSAINIFLNMKSAIREVICTLKPFVRFSIKSNGSFYSMNTVFHILEPIF